MGLFDRFKGKKTVDWSAAYTAVPKFYGRPDGTPFGAIALTEGTETVLPTAPQAAYQVDGQPVAAWRMVIVSTTRITSPRWRKPRPTGSTAGRTPSSCAGSPRRSWRA